MKLLTNLLFEPKGKHDPALAYNIKDTVMSADGSKVYFALQDVPAGTALSNGDYWKLQIDLSSSKSAMDQALATFGNYAKEIGIRVRGETAKVSGNSVTFLPDAGSLLQPVTVLEPQQQGSGDPYPTGGGKNLFDKADVTENAFWSYAANVSAVVTLDGYFASALISVTSNATYTLTNYISNAGVGLIKYWTDAGISSGGIRAGDVVTSDGSKHIYTFTVPDGVKYVSITGDMANIDKVQLEAGSTATEYAPYENIRPISGYDALNLTAAGVNLYNRDAIMYGYGLASNGGLFQDDTLITTDYIRVIPGASYRIGWYSAQWLGLFGSNSSESIIEVTNASDSILIPPAGCNYIRVTFQAAEYHSFYVSAGTDAASYEPYAGHTYTVHLGQTVYGGKFDWLTGKGLIEWALATLTGDETDWALSAAGNFYSYNVVRNLGSDEGYCSHYKTTNDLGSTDAAIAFYAGDTAAIRDSRFASVADWKAFLTAQSAAGTPVQIVYKLANPIEIQLTPHIISAADPEQTNTLYGDGRIDVEYVKPLHVSIEERVAAAVAAAMNTEGE